VSQYQKKHSPTHHPYHHPVFISFFHLPRSIASSLFKLRGWQSFCTTCAVNCYIQIYMIEMCVHMWTERQLCSWQCCLSWLRTLCSTETFSTFASSAAARSTRQDQGQCCWCVSVLFVGGKILLKLKITNFTVYKFFVFLY